MLGTFSISASSSAERSASAASASAASAPKAFALAPSAGRSAGSAVLKLALISFLCRRSSSIRVLRPRTCSSSASRRSTSSTAFFSAAALRTASGCSRMECRLSMVP
jgi:hypothetical protein